MSLFGVDVPGLGNIWTRVQDAVKQGTSAAFNGAVDYIWKPLVKYLSLSYRIATNTVDAIGEILDAVNAIGEWLDEFSRNGPSIIAGWLLKGFLIWIEPLGDLLEDLIVKDWDAGASRPGRPR